MKAKTISFSLNCERLARATEYLEKQGHRPGTPSEVLNILLDMAGVDSLMPEENIVPYLISTFPKFMKGRKNIELPKAFPNLEVDALSDELFKERS